MVLFWELIREQPKERLFATRIVRRSTTLRHTSRAVERVPRPIPKISQLALHRYATGRDSRVVRALTMLKSHGHQGQVSSALVLGGMDVSGPHLHAVYLHGSTGTLPFATMGSGSLAAISVFESRYKENLTVLSTTTSLID